MSVPDIHPSREEFAALAANHRVVPVWTELVSDAETPVTAFAKISGEEPAFLFESAEQDERSGRYSILGAGAEREFIARGNEFEVRRQGKVVRSGRVADPLAELEREMSGLRAPEGTLHFPGGCVGYMSYDAVRYFEPTVPPHQEDALGLPDLYFFTTDRVLVFDHVTRRLKVIVNAYPGTDPQAAYAAACAKLSDLLSQLDRPTSLKPSSPSIPPTPAPVSSNTGEADFLASVERAKEYIRAGDVFQIVLSQRFATPYTGSPLELYRALRFINPSPYMFLIRCPGFHLVGSSPEVHVRVDEGQVQIRPIAGTIRRGSTSEEDNANAQKLLADPKERAEHLMLVDLARNDVGRIAEYKSVRVTDFMTIERYSHVMHIVSNVVGSLSPGHSTYDVMRATFPAGTVSGAPKVRAMQIINALEKSKRCSYAGAVGYFGYDGNLNSCIALRTVLLKDGTAYVQAGAGVVADSTPQGEYQETINKAMGVIRAIERARTVEQS
ncbi:MAG: anthranilate synthase component I [Chthoniobacterales bacterium]|nr:anthranilate synthase component I [Chthoniobacterales bacterium]